LRILLTNQFRKFRMVIYTHGAGERNTAARGRRMVLKILRRVFEPIAIVMMLAGIVGLIQPFHIELFRWGFNVLWIGLVGYMIFSHFPR
jgi:hypothetical protein